MCFLQAAQRSLDSLGLTPKKPFMFTRGAWTMRGEGRRRGGARRMACWEGWNLWALW